MKPGVSKVIKTIVDAALQGYPEPQGLPSRRRVAG